MSIFINFTALEITKNSNNRNPVLKTASFYCFFIIFCKQKFETYSRSVIICRRNPGMDINSFAWQNSKNFSKIGLLDPNLPLSFKKVSILRLDSFICLDNSREWFILSST